MANLVTTIVLACAITAKTIPANVTKELQHPLFHISVSVPRLWTDSEANTKVGCLFVSGRRKGEYFFEVPNQGPNRRTTFFCNHWYVCWRGCFSLTYRTIPQTIYPLLYDLNTGIDMTMLSTKQVQMSLPTVSSEDSFWVIYLLQNLECSVESEKTLLLPRLPLVPIPY